MTFLSDPYTWVIASFLLFAGVAYKLGVPVLLRRLDEKIATIRKEIETAEMLRAEANALLLEYEQRQHHAQIESDKMVAAARDQAEALRAREEERLEEVMRRKEQQLTERLNLLRDQAVADLRGVAANLAFEATQNLVTSKLDEATRAQLIDRAISQMAQRHQG